MPYTAPPASTSVATLTHRWKFDSHAGADGVGIQTLAPLTGSGNLTQATAANRPTLVHNAVNGKKAARWLDAAGGTQFMTASTGTAPAQPVTYVDVIRPGATIPTATGSANYIQVWAWGHEFHTDAGKWRLWAGVGFTAATFITLNVWQIVITVVNGASSAIYVNGTLVATGNAGTGAPGATLTLGRYTTASRFFRGDMAENMRYTGAADANTRALIDSYGQDEYAIAVSDYLATGTAYTAQGSLPVSVGLPSLSSAAAAARASLPISVGWNGLTATSVVAQGSLSASAGLNGPTAAARASSGVLPASVGLEGRASVDTTVAGSLPAIAGISSSSTAEVAAAGALPATVGLGSTSTLDADAAGALGAAAGLAGPSTVAGATSSELRATVEMRGTTGVAATAFGSLPITVGFSGEPEIEGPVDYAVSGVLPITIGLASSTTAQEQAAGTLNLTADVASSTSLDVDAAAVLPASVDLRGNAAAQLQAWGSLPIIVGFDEDTEILDVELAGQLEPRRWAGELLERTKVGVLEPRRWQGEIPERARSGELGDRRWKGSLS